MSVGQLQNESPVPQSGKRLLLIVAAAVALVWYWDYASRAGTTSGESIVERITKDPIPLVDFGLTITPSEGWTYLKVTGKDADGSMKFVNESQRLIVSIEPVLFRQWPPQLSQRVDDGDRGRTVIQSAVPIITQYKHVAIDWFVEETLPYGERRMGRINTERQELLIQVLKHHGVSETQNAAISQLCDDIGPLY